MALSPRHLSCLLSRPQRPSSMKAEPALGRDGAIVRDLEPPPPAARITAATSPATTALGARNCVLPATDVEFGEDYGRSMRVTQAGDLLAP